LGKRRRAFPKHGIQGAYEEIRAYVLDNTERWMELCALAAEEHDSVKLLALTQEITRMLDEKKQRLKGNVPSISPASAVD